MICNRYDVMNIMWHKNYRERWRELVPLIYIIRHYLYIILLSCLWLKNFKKGGGGGGGSRVHDVHIMCSGQLTRLNHSFVLTSVSVYDRLSRLTVTQLYLSRPLSFISLLHSKNWSELTTQFYNSSKPDVGGECWQRHCVYQDLTGLNYFGYTVQYQVLSWHY